MEFQETVLKRRMVRNFADRPVAPEIIDRILDLTRHAPSAGFTQGQSFIVVTDPQTKKSRRRNMRRGGIRQKRIRSIHLESAGVVDSMH